MENKLIKVQLALLLLRRQTVLSSVHPDSLKCPCALEGSVGSSPCTTLERKRNLAEQSTVSEELCSELLGRKGGILHKIFGCYRARVDPTGL